MGGSCSAVIFSEKIVDDTTAIKAPSANNGDFYETNPFRNKINDPRPSLSIATPPITNYGTTKLENDFRLHHTSVIGLEECSQILNVENISTRLKYNGQKSFIDAAIRRINLPHLNDRNLFRIQPDCGLEMYSIQREGFQPISYSNEDSTSNVSLMEWFRENVEKSLQLQKKTNPNNVMKDLVIDTSSVLRGYYDPLTVVSIPEFRPFISSTFTDTAMERDLMILLVYPFLDQYARSSGVSFFQPSEMRWGIGPSLSKKHLTSSVCLDELRRCQHSQGLSYFLILGDKYGSRFPRASIAIEDFSLLIASVSNEKDVNFVLSWYILDSNHSVYLLRYLDSEDLENRFWNGDAIRLHAILAVAAGAVFDKSDPKRALYTLSITHEEAFIGIDCLEPRKRNESVAVLIRNIEGIDQIDLKNESMANMIRNWVDVIIDKKDSNNQCTLNNIARNALWKEKELIFSNSDNRFNVISYSIPWSDHGIDMTLESHRLYLQEFLRHITTIMAKSIDKISNAGGLHIYCASDTPFSEAIAHNKSCVDQMLSFIHETLQGLKDNSNSPYFTVLGQSGAGKTSIMAAAMHSIRQQWPNANIIIRFLGTTSNSTDIVPFLQVVIAHIIRLYPSISITTGNTSDYKELCNIFNDVLHAIPDSNPLIILLDSLDQLSSLNKAKHLAFLPQSISNKSVCILLSSLPEQEYVTWPRLKSMFPPNGPSSILVPPWSIEDGETVLEAMLTKQQFQLTSEQKQLVLDKFGKSTTPTSLYLVLELRIAYGWNSFDTVDKISLPDNVQGCILQLFNSLCTSHGKVLVMTFLALITVSGGLSFDELLHVLSLNDDVLEEVFEWWNPPIRRLPPLLLTRIISELEPFLVRRVNFGVEEIFWYHRQFWKAAQKFAVANDDAEKGVHIQLAEYFSGKWHKVPKPYASNNRKFDATSTFVELVTGINSHSATSGLVADRLVPSQPWIAEGGIANKRKLWMLPKHAVKSCMWNLVELTLCSIEILECAKQANMIQELKTIYHNSIDFVNEISLTIDDQNEKLLLEQLLAKLLAFNNFFKRDYQNISECCLVLQSCLYTPAESLVRQAAVQYFQKISSLNDADWRLVNNINNWCDINRSLVIAQNLPEKSDIISKVIISSNSSCYDTYFDLSKNHVYTAVFDNDSKRVLVYNMIDAELSFNCSIQLQGSGKALKWSPSGRMIACIGEDAVLHVVTVSDAFDGIMSYVTIKIDFVGHNRDDYAFALNWSTESFVFVGRAVVRKSNRVSQLISSLNIFRKNQIFHDVKAIRINHENIENSIPITGVINDNILNEIVSNSYGTYETTVHSLISPQGKYFVVCSKFEPVHVLVLTGPRKNSRYEINLTSCHSLGGSSGITSICFSKEGYLYLSMRGNIVIYQLGDTWKQCKRIKQACAEGEYNEIMNKKISNWTDFTTCSVSPAENTLIVGDEGGSLWVLENMGDTITDLERRSAHSKAPKLIQFDDSMEILITAVDSELFLWDLKSWLYSLRVSNKEASSRIENSANNNNDNINNNNNNNDALEQKKHVHDPLMSAVGGLCWKPDGSIFIAIASWDGKLAAYDGISGQQTQCVKESTLSYVVFDNESNEFKIPNYFANFKWNACDSTLSSEQEYIFVAKSCLFQSSSRGIAVKMNGFDYADIAAPLTPNEIQNGYVPSDNELKFTYGITLDFYNITDNSLLCQIDLPESRRMQGGGIAIERKNNLHCTNIQFIAMEIDFSDDLKLLAVPGNINDVIFYQLHWSKNDDVWSVQAELLVHHFTCPSPMTSVRFRPRPQSVISDDQNESNNQHIMMSHAGDDKKYTIAIGCKCGSVFLVSLEL
eukprot:gene10217-13746_t